MEESYDYTKEEIESKSKELGQLLHNIEKNFTSKDNGLAYHTTYWDNGLKILNSDYFTTGIVADRLSFQVAQAKKYSDEIKEYAEKSKKLFTDEPDISLIGKLNKEFHKKIYDTKDKLDFVMKTLDDDKPRLFFYKHIFQYCHERNSLKYRFKGSSFVFVVDMDSLDYKVREIYYDRKINEAFFISKKDAYINEFINKRKLYKRYVQDELALNEEVNTNRIKRFYLIKDFKVIAIYNKINEESYELFYLQKTQRPPLSEDKMNKEIDSKISELNEYIIRRDIGADNNEYPEKILDLQIPLLINKLSQEEAKYKDNGLIGYHLTFMTNALSILNQGIFKPSEMQAEIYFQTDMCESFIEKMDYYQSEAENHHSQEEFDLMEACMYQVKRYGKLYDLMKKSIDLSPKLFFHEDIRQSYNDKYLRETRKGNAIIFVCDLSDLDIKNKKFFLPYATATDNSSKGIFYLDQYSDKEIWNYVKDENMISSNWENELVVNHELPTSRVKRMYLIKDYKIDSVIVRNNDDSFEYRLVEETVN